MTTTTSSPSLFTLDEAQQLTEELKRAAANLIDLIGKAYTGRIWVALDYQTWEAYCREELDACLVFPRKDRNGMILSLRELGLSTRAIAPIVDLSKSEVHRRLSRDGTDEGDEAELHSLAERRYRERLNPPEDDDDDEDVEEEDYYYDDDEDDEDEEEEEGTTSDKVLSLDGRERPARRSPSLPGDIVGLDGSQIPDPEEVRTIIRAKYERGQSLPSIVRYLRRKRVPAPPGSPWWDEESAYTQLAADAPTSAIEAEELAHDIVVRLRCVRDFVGGTHLAFYNSFYRDRHLPKLTEVDKTTLTTLARIREAASDMLDWLEIDTDDLLL